MTQKRKNYLVKAAIFGVPAIVVVCLLAQFGTIADGAFPLRVQVSSESEREIALLTCDVLSGQEKAQAEQYANNILKAKAAGHVDKGFLHHESMSGECVVKVPSSTRGQYFGLHVTYSQFKWLLVQIDYSDGTEYHQVVEIPDGRKSQTLTVPIP